jgi:hypothetical protein
MKILKGFVIVGVVGFNAFSATIDPTNAPMYAVLAILVAVLGGINLATLR